MQNVLKYIAIVSLSVLAFGCPNKIKTETFNDGLLSNDYLVGGGFGISYAAPSAGTVYIVDLASGKYLLTQSVETGERIELDIEPDDDEMKSRLASMGLDLSKLNLKLFFIPSKTNPNET